MTTRTAFQSLPSFFYETATPTVVGNPQWIAWNSSFAEQLQLPASLQDQTQALGILSGNQAYAEFEPYAASYAGHQFGHFNPRLGDGRAITIAEILDSTQQRWEIQLKGAGRTAFSRGGDGRSPIGPVLREYLVSETMAVYGVPTTRALAAIATGEWVYRESPQPGAILTRVAQSHVRVGSFQFAAAHGGEAQVNALTHFMIQYHFPALTSHPFPAIALLDEVVSRQARLIAQWMQLGFIHGVMNTDNMSILGDTIDYGPCAFMDTFRANQVYSFIDKNGRYRYQRQPRIAQWNLSRFAESLLVVHVPQRESTEQAVTEMKAIVEQFIPRYENYYFQGMYSKLGLPKQIEVSDADKRWVTELLSIAEAQQIDYTRMFLHLEQWLDTQQLHSELGEADVWQSWLAGWLSRLEQADISRQQALLHMQQVNPTLIPRNHLIAEAIRSAETEGDLTLFHELLTHLQQPFDRDMMDHRFARPPKVQEQIENTFCGT